MNTLLSMYILGVGGVGWIPFSPACNPVPPVMYAMGVGPMKMASGVAPLPAMVVSVSPASVKLSTVQVGN